MNITDFQSYNPSTWTTVCYNIVKQISYMYKKKNIYINY